MPPPLASVVGRRDPPVLLSLPLSVAVLGPIPFGKMTLLNILERQPFFLMDLGRFRAYALAALVSSS